jgi:hypothetical protein
LQGSGEAAAHITVLACFLVHLCCHVWLRLLLIAVIPAISSSALSILLTGCTTFALKCWPRMSLAIELVIDSAKPRLSNASLERPTATRSPLTALSLPAYATTRAHGNDAEI